MSTKPMISYYIQFAVFLCCHSFGDYSRENCPPYAINYMDWKMTFPSTVGEAAKAHQLDYKPPGSYHKKILVNRGEVILNYKYKTGDFHDEYQPREILFPVPREVDIRELGKTYCPSSMIPSRACLLEIQKHLRFIKNFLQKNTPSGAICLQAMLLIFASPSQPTTA